MAATPRGASIGKNGNVKSDPADLEAEIARLREDVSRLTDELSRTGRHSYSAAQRAAREGADHLRATSQAAVDALKSNAGDVEQQVVTAVREKPLTALAIAAGIGCLLGLMSRR